MPHYPTSVALMPQLPAKVLLAGANTIQSGLEYIHSSNYCHLDILFNSFVFLALQSL